MKVAFFLIITIYLTGNVAAEPLTWNTVRQLAINSNRQLSASNQGVISAQKAFKIAQANEQFNVDLLSSVSVSKEGTEISDNPLTWRTSDDSSAGELAVQLTQVVWDGGKRRNQTISQRYAAEIQGNDLYQESAIVRQKLSTEFLSLWYYQALLKLNKAILKRRETQLKLIENKYKVGLENLGALLVTQANVDDSKYQILETQQNSFKSRLTLSQLVVSDLSAYLEIVLPKDLSKESATVPSFTIIEALTLGHPAVKRAAIKTQLAETQIAIAKAQYAPDVTFTARAGKALSNPFHDNTAHTDQWTLKIVGVQPLWDSGVRENQIKQAEADRDRQLILLDDFTASISTQLKIALSDCITAINAWENRKLTSSAVKERAKIMQVQYESGLVSFNDWNLVEDKLIEAQKAELTAQRNVYIAHTNWIYARGGTLNDPY